MENNTNRLKKVLLEKHLENTDFTPLVYHDRENTPGIYVLSHQVIGVSYLVHMPTLSIITPLYPKSANATSCDSPYSAERKSAMGSLLDILETVTEIMELWSAGASMDSYAVSNYRVLLESDNFILAAREDKNCGLYFVTWQIDNDRKGVCIGNYFGADYKGAKNNFTERSGESSSK